MLLPDIFYLILFWLMLLPMFVADVITTLVWHNVVADVIAKWQMEWPL